jgi:hypothetical protein
MLSRSCTAEECTLSILWIGSGRFKILNESLGGRCDGCNIVATACVTFWFSKVKQWREMILRMSETNK